MNTKELNKLFISLNKQGIKLSTGRRVVLSVLAQAKKPLSAADILKAKLIIEKKINRATVYRSLSFLENIGVVELLYLVGDKRLYHLNLKHHHHLICSNCKKIEAIYITNKILAQEAKIQADTGFKVERHVLEFYGLCSECLKKKKNLN